MTLDTKELRRLLAEASVPIAGRKCFAEADYARALHNAAPALINAAEDVERLRADLAAARMEARAYSNALQRQKDHDERIVKIKAIREETGCGLKEALDIVNGKPGVAADVVKTMSEEMRRLRAFVPVWVRVIGAWELRACGVRVGWIEWAGRDHIARVDVGRGGWKAAGTHPDIPTAARAVCDALGVPYVAVGEVAGE